MLDKPQPDVGLAPGPKATRQEIGEYKQSVESNRRRLFAEARVKDLIAAAWFATLMFSLLAGVLLVCFFVYKKLASEITGLVGPFSGTSSLLLNVTAMVLILAWLWKNFEHVRRIVFETIFAERTNFIVAFAGLACVWLLPGWVALLVFAGIAGADAFFLELSRRADGRSREALAEIGQGLAHQTQGVTSRRAAEGTRL